MGILIHLFKDSYTGSSAGSGAVAAAGQQALRVRQVLAGVQAQGDAPPPHERSRREVQVSHMWQMFPEQLLSRQTPQAARQLRAHTAPTAAELQHPVPHV